MVALYRFGGKGTFEMTNVIKTKLEQLKEMDAHREAIRLDKEAAISLILTDEIKAKLADVDAEFDLLTDALNETAKVLESEIKTAVLSHGATVKGVYMAVYSRGRVNWNTKALAGYAVAHPEIEKFKKVGNPSVSIRKK